MRGLDYYTGTVFEWVSGKLGAQNAVCAGGRYDQLVENRGGKPTPAVGFALGLERLVELVRGGAATDDRRDDRCDDTEVYVVSATEQARPSAVKVSEILRRGGIAVTTHCGGGALKKQMRGADLSGARLAVIAGLDEGEAGTVGVKPLRDGGDQRQVGVDGLVEWCRDNLPAMK